MFYFLGSDKVLNLEWLKNNQGMLEEFYKANGMTVMVGFVAVLYKKNLIVEVGKGHYVKKTPEETVNVVEGQLDKLMEGKNQIMGRLEELQNDMMKMIGEIEQAQAKGGKKD